MALSILAAPMAISTLLNSCSSMNRPETYTPNQGEEMMELFHKVNEQRVTIVQVTHSEKNASYGKRVIQLRDGWIVNK